MILETTFMDQSAWVLRRLLFISSRQLHETTIEIFGELRAQVGRSAVSLIARAAQHQIEIAFLKHLKPETVFVTHADIDKAELRRLGYRYVFLGINREEPRHLRWAIMRNKKRIGTAEVGFRDTPQLASSPFLQSAVRFIVDVPQGKLTVEQPLPLVDISRLQRKYKDQ